MASIKSAQFFAATSSASPSSAVSSLLTASLSLAAVLSAVLSVVAAVLLFRKYPMMRMRWSGPGLPARQRAFCGCVFSCVCFLSYLKRCMARKGTAKHTYQKTRPFCVQNGNTKRPRTFSRLFAVQPIPRDLELCAPVPGSGQVSWLKDQHPPPPSRADAQ